MAGAALFATLIGVWIYNSSAASGYNSKRQGIQNNIDLLAAADKNIKDAEAREAEFQARAGHLETAITDQKYWVSMLNELNGLMKDDQIWIVQISPMGEGGTEVTKALWGNSPDWQFEQGKRGGPAATSRTKIPVTDLFVVAINRNGENSGDNAVQFFKSIVNSPKTKDLFEFQFKNDDDLIQKYLVHQVGDLATKDGYAFMMRLPLKRKVEAYPAK
jgi:hypothetical protein